MHDSQVEDRLRRILRTEGEEIPFTVTTAELERRLIARRRAASGRRLSWVAAGLAAIAVGGMVAVSNGWISPPGVATQPSPTPATTAMPSRAATPSLPSPATVNGLGPIARQPDAPVLLEAPPQISDGTADVFEVGASALDLFIRIRLACVGDDQVEVTAGTHAPEFVPCRSAEGTGDPAHQPSVTEYPVDHLPYRVVVDAPAGFAYTILVEHVTLPDSLPPLDPSESGASGVLAFDATSESDRPGTGPDAGTVTRAVGSMPEALVRELQFVCLGPGTMIVAIGQIGSPTASTSTTTLCSGQPRTFDDGTGNPGTLDVYVTTDTRTAWHVIGSKVGELPAFEPPALYATSWFDGEGRGEAATRGVVGCTFDWTLADGRKGTVDCMSNPQPELADLPRVVVAPGGEVRFEIEPPWTVSAPIVKVTSLALGQTTEPIALPFTSDAGRIIHVPIGLKADEYFLTVEMSGKSTGASFRGPYVYVISVEP
jgi:hypothetical protein